MNFLSNLQTLLAEWVSTEYSSEELIRVLDLTLLDEKASTADLAALAQQAQDAHVAAVCVYPQHLSHFHSINPLSLATVINFPSGQEGVANTLALLKKALEEGVKEIDYVFPYDKYLQGKKEAALQECEQILSFCQKHALRSKIILETGAFPNLQILYEAACQLTDLGVDFLKTSTGKIASGANLAVVFVLLSAIKQAHNPCGIKISGGVKTPAQAAQYANLAEKMLNKKINASWFRIGASSLLHELRAQ